MGLQIHHSLLFFFLEWSRGRGETEDSGEQAENCKSKSLANSGVFAERLMGVGARMPLSQEQVENEGADTQGGC